MWSWEQLATGLMTAASSYIVSASRLYHDIRILAQISIAFLEGLFVLFTFDYISTAQEPQKTSYSTNSSLLMTIIKGQHYSTRIRESGCNDADMHQLMTRPK